MLYVCLSKVMNKYCDTLNCIEDILYIKYNDNFMLLFGFQTTIIGCAFLLNTCPKSTLMLIY